MSSGNYKNAFRHSYRNLFLHSTAMVVISLVKSIVFNSLLRPQSQVRYCLSSAPTSLYHTCRNQSNYILQSYSLAMLPLTSYKCHISCFVFPCTANHPSQIYVSEILNTRYVLKDSLSLRSKQRSCLISLIEIQHQLHVYFLVPQELFPN